VEPSRLAGRMLRYQHRYNIESRRKEREKKEKEGKGDGNHQKGNKLDIRRRKREQ
jgi:hypothetical protein